MREMVEKYNTILVVGGEGEKCRQVAEGYGFRDVVTPGDIIKDNAATTPFRKLTKEEHANSRQRDSSTTKIEAIFVYVSPPPTSLDVPLALLASYASPFSLNPGITVLSAKAPC
jgi:hypothetical protein